MLSLCIASALSAGCSDSLCSNGPAEEPAVEQVTEAPYTEAFLPTGTIRASTMVSTDGTVCERIRMAPQGAVGQNDLEALKNYCQKNRMLSLLAYLDEMDGAKLRAILAGGQEMSVTVNASQGEAPSGRGNFDEPIVFVDDAFFGMKDGNPYIGITDPFSLQIEERREKMLTCFDKYAATHGIADYRLEGLDEKIKELADLEDQAAVAPDYSSVLVVYEDNEKTVVETPIAGRDQLDPRIYEEYLFEVEVVRRAPA